MRVADVGSPSATTVADKENNSKCKAREQGGKPLRKPRNGLYVHSNVTSRDERELMDPVQKAGGSNSSRKLVVHCFIYIYIYIYIYIAQFIGARTVWIR
jgi:hypothetical protein